ncbi:SH3 and multiple ankyrin repeat domains protein 2b [Aplochiton taeniatus]
MPRSPTSSEEEMARSLSEGSAGSDSDSSKEGPRLGAEQASRRASRAAACRQDSLAICVVIPDLQQSKCLHFEPGATVWVAKQQILCTLTQPLRDVLNYGLFQPALQGRQSGFLDEEQPLREHPVPTCQGVPTLEFRYKSRVYKQPNVNEKQIAKIHTQANLRMFMDHIQHLQVAQVEKMLEKGLDPNYHDPDTGETPLTFAAHLDNVVSVIVALRNGGAHLDFRSQDGMTALHKAVGAKNRSSLKVLLDLGASPNYKDSQSLTALYQSVLVGGDAGCCELLLRANAAINCHDENGWHEIHQASRYGHIQHVEHLLNYGADISVQNTSGNTALHICALYRQELCARLLLARGASKEAKNYRGQTPFQVAIIAGNFELAEFIKNHKETDIVPFREAPGPQQPPGRRQPQQAPSSRSTLAAPRVLLRSNSDTNLNVAKLSPQRGLSPRRPSQQIMPSPNGTVKTVGGPRGGRAPPRSRSPSLGRLGEESRRHTQQQQQQQQQRQSSPHRGGLGGGEDQQGQKRKLFSGVPGRLYVVVRPYQPQAEGEITLYKNDRVKVLSIGDGGYWEGSSRGNVGWFPAECLEEIPTQAHEERPYARADRAERRKLFRHYTVGSYDSFDASSDCVVDEKTVVLQKKDNEGFGFVLRGAKADTPIEEFTPTPAFPALQYLESVDEGGVAWQAGLRTGDFLIQVNQDNVVKVGHKQVVNMIRHGGNRLIIKVVTVSRNLDPDDTARKKAPAPPRRAPSTALSMAMRSKSMTSELEELATLRRKKGDDQSCDLEGMRKRIVFQVTLNKVDENMSPHGTVWDNSNSSKDMRMAANKPRPTSRCFPMSPEMNSMCDSQEVSVQTAAIPGSPRAAYLGVPKGTMRRQKSIGITEEEKQFLTPPMLKFTRSLSMPDTSEDIPPPPAISPPSPPNYTNSPAPQGRGYGTIRSGFTQNSTPKSPTTTERGGDWRGGGGVYYTPEENYNNHSAPMTAQQSFLNRRAQVPENPYLDLGKMASGIFTSNKASRRKGMLVKQSKVEDSPEKTCSIPIPTIIIKEPSTSSSGKSSQGSSMEIETGAHDLPGQLRPEDGHSPASPFASAMAVAVRDRESRLAAHRHSPSFRSTDMGDEDSAPPSPLPRLRHSKSIDEGMFTSDERLRRLMAPPSSLLSIPRRGGGGGGGGNVTDFNSPEPTMVRELLNTRTGHHHHSPVSLPAKSYASSSSSSSSSPAGGGPYVHPVTGKPLDPNSPLALALAARDRAMREQSQPLPLKSQPPKADLIKPLFIDTKLTRPNAAPATTATMGRAGARASLRRQMTEAKYETESKYEHPLAKEEKQRHQKAAEEKKKMLIDIVDTSQQHKTAGLLMVHTADDHGPPDGEREETGAVSPDSAPGELRDPNQPVPPSPKPSAAPPSPGKPHLAALAPRGKTIITISSVDEPVKLPFGIPPPPLASVDLPEDSELFADPLPPPLEFANSFDIPEDQASAIAELLKHNQNAAARAASLAPYYPHLAPGPPGAELKRGPALLTNCMPASFPTPAPAESYEPVSDSGIEEVDSRSSGDPQLETTSTVSTVSSISTLSSEGGEGLDTCTVYADGHAFPKTKPSRGRTPNALYNHKEPGALALGEDSLRNYGGPPSSMPPPPPGEPPKTPTQRGSRLWGEAGEGKGPLTPKAGDATDSGTRTVFGSRNPDPSSHSSGTQRNTVTFSSMATTPSACRQSDSLPTSHPPHHRAPSPILSPPDSGLGCASSSLPISAASPSPTLTDMFGLPTPPLSLGTGRSRSPSPLTILQAPSSKPFASKPLVMWSKEDVADWLESLNLAEHRHAFLDNDIEGSHLPSLQKDDLIDLGVTRVGHRMNIERALKLLMDR